MWWYTRSRWTGIVGGMPIVPVKILADHGERRSGLPERLAELGLEVEVTALPVGDFVIAGRVAIERKTVADLHRSISSRRLWRQVGALRGVFERRYLLVEGEVLSAGPVVEAGVRGALLAAVESGVPVIWARDVEKSALGFAPSPCVFAGPREAHEHASFGFGRNTRFCELCPGSHRTSPAAC